MSTEKSVTEDLTTCTICLNLCDNPKSLPCIHGFCLKCLQGYFKDKHPGDKAPCPICRKEFQIPPEELDGLPHHFFVQQLVDVRKASTTESEEVLCEVCTVCSEESEDSDKIPVASMYCIDCSQKLCQQCSRPHKKLRGGAHQVTPLGVEVEQELIHLRASLCDKHKEEQVKLYCRDCDENICLMCSAVKHRHHNSVEIPEAADNFRSRIYDDSTMIQLAVNGVRQQSREAKQSADELSIKVENMMKQVRATANEIKRSVDDQESVVIKELELVTHESEKQAVGVEGTCQLALMSMESFQRYSRELLEKGRPSDITRAACQLHDRATELLNNDVTAVKYHPPHVTFTPVDVTQIRGLNLIGKVTVATKTKPESSPPSVLCVETDREKELAQQLKQAEDREGQQQQQLDKMKDVASGLQKIFFSQRSMGHVITTLAERTPIWGVATLDNHLYVLRAGKSSEQIEVYDVDSFCFLHYLTVPGLGTAADIVVCEHSRCAYVSNHLRNSVHKVPLSGDATTQWPVNDEPRFLSLTVKHNLLVTCFRVRKIKEFTTDGQLLREVVLPQDVCTPWHTLQLSSGELILCHGEPDDQLHRVCQIDSEGQVAKSFGGPRGSGSQGMNTPAHMALDFNDFVFVADLNNCRVLLLSPTLTYVRDVVSRDQLKWKPLRLSLDVQRRRLYVAVNEWKDGKHTAGRVVVVKV